MKVKSESEVAQSCPTLSDPMGCSLPGSSIHGIFQARVLEWGAFYFYLMLNSYLRITSSFIIKIKFIREKNNIRSFYLKPGNEKFQGVFS